VTENTEGVAYRNVAYRDDEWWEGLLVDESMNIERVERG